MNQSVQSAMEVIAAHFFGSYIDGSYYDAYLLLQNEVKANPSIEHIEGLTKHYDVQHLCWADILNELNTQIDRHTEVIEFLAAQSATTPKSTPNTDWERALAKATEMLVEKSLHSGQDAHYANYLHLKQLNDVSLPDYVTVKKGTFCSGIQSLSSLVDEIEFLARGLLSSNRPDVVSLRSNEL